MNDQSAKPKVYKAGDKIEGDRIFASCQKPGKWEEYRKSKQHNAHKCILRKDASAVVEKPFTNIKP